MANTRMAMHQLSGADVDVDVGQISLDLETQPEAGAEPSTDRMVDFALPPRRQSLTRSHSARAASDEGTLARAVTRGTSQSYRIRRHSPDTLPPPNESLDVMAHANTDGVFTPVRGNSPVPPSESSSRATSPVRVRPARRAPGHGSARSSSAEAGLMRSGRGSSRSQRSLASRAGSSADLATALSDSVERLKTAV